MKILKLLIPVLLSIVWLVGLTIQINSSIPKLGSFFHPISGFWGNATAVNLENDGYEFPENINSESASVVFNERLVPTITTKEENDLYFLQGYTHAYFRLWQMDMQYRAAGGFLSEVIGNKTLQHDRSQRRKGMLLAAQQTLNAIMEEPLTRNMLLSYTEGVNSYIESLTNATLPLEYKLMNFKPALWTPLKSAIIMKLLADDLTGKSDDIGMSLLRATLPDSIIDEIFPVRINNAIPVIPNEAINTVPSVHPAKLTINNPFVTLQNATTINDSAITYVIPEEGNGKGSNNWAFSGNITASGQPILANDPHLSLNLPAIWFENRLISSGLNVYGVSIPGAPGVVIGFNDAIAWGFTNNYRDVKDYFQITYNSINNSYVYNGTDKKAHIIYDTIHIKINQPILILLNILFTDLFNTNLICLHLKVVRLI